MKCNVDRRRGRLRREGHPDLGGDPRVLPWCAGRDGRRLVLELRGAGGGVARGLRRGRAEHEPRAYARTHHATSGTCRCSRCGIQTGFTTLLVSRAGELTDLHDLKGGRSRSGALTRRRRRSCPPSISPAPVSGGEDFEPCDSTPTWASTATRARASEALTAVLVGRADAAAVGAATWGALVRGGDVLESLAPFWTSPAQPLHLHGPGVAGRASRRSLDAPPDGDGLGEHRPSADPRARGTARVGRPGPRRLPGRLRGGSVPGDRRGW